MTPVDELKLEALTSPGALATRLAEWSRRVTQRFREVGVVQVVGPLRVDPSDLPLEFSVSSVDRVRCVSLHSAIAIDAQADTISGGAVTWSVQSGLVRVSAVPALTGGTAYDATFKVEF